jgi:uncharacterized membrane protein (DUF485 family)
MVCFCPRAGLGSGLRNVAIRRRLVDEETMSITSTFQNAVETRVAADPRYLALVRDRQRFTWLLTAITVIVYSSFISLIAFDKPLMAQPIGDGTISIAVVLGLAMLIGTVGICAVYVRRANGEFDSRLAALLADVTS